MTMPSHSSGDAPAQVLPVYRADHFLVANGANLGDPMMEASHLVMDDVYQLTPTAELEPLTVRIEGEDFLICGDSAAGTPGLTLHLDCVATFMVPDGGTIEVLVFVALEEGEIDDIFLLPLSQLQNETGYRLIRVERQGARSRLAQIACVSFTRGTRITMANGAQVPIEDLKAGDKVLTRDMGPQEIRWIGSSTVRATGAMTPIKIEAGALNNEGDLIVSPNHRLFIYQREDALGVGRSEVMVKASQLLNGTTVTRADGGFVDYFQLLFDDHQIIYAEGIAAESLMLDTATRPAVPSEVARRLRDASRGEKSGIAELEVSGTLIGADAVERLRRASSR